MMVRVCWTEDGVTVRRDLSVEAAAELKDKIERDPHAEVLWTAWVM